MAGLLSRGKGIRRKIQDLYGHQNTAEDEAWRVWSIDNDTSLNGGNIPEDDGKPDVPKRQRIAGKDHGLSILVVTEKKVQVCPISESGGLMVIQNGVHYSES